MTCQVASRILCSEGPSVSASFGKTEESEFIIHTLQQTLPGRANQGDEIRHGRYGLREVTHIQLQLKTANGREYLGGPDITGRKCL
jgi:hypothetical protein